jgi:hypothetical protein
MKTHTCNISNCTKDATHAVDGNPDQGYEARRLDASLAIWAEYCEGHAADVALAFTAVYTEKDRNRALDALEALEAQRAADRPITANRPPAPYDAADEAWAERFLALCQTAPAYEARAL